MKFKKKCLAMDSDVGSVDKTYDWKQTKNDGGWRITLLKKGSPNLKSNVEVKIKINENNKLKNKVENHVLIFFRTDLL